MTTFQDRCRRIESFYSRTIIFIQNSIRTCYSCKGMCNFIFTVKLFQIIIAELDQLTVHSICLIYERISAAGPWRIGNAFRNRKNNLFIFFNCSLSKSFPTKCKQAYLLLSNTSGNWKALLFVTNCFCFLLQINHV